MPRSEDANIGSVMAALRALDLLSRRFTICIYVITLFKIFNYYPNVYPI